MQRREFIIFGGAAVAWPLAVYAQQGERVRRVGVLTGTSERDPEAQARHAAFVEGLQELGWVEGRNLRIHARWTAGDGTVTQKYAVELVELAPDVILVGGGSSIGAVLQATRTVPVVFAFVPDPVGSGFVDSLSQPGANATGFMQFEYSLCGKWLELLKEVAPRVTRAAVLWDPSIPAGIGQFAVIQSVAASVGVDVRAINVRDAAEIERGVSGFARVPNGGLIVTGSALSAAHTKVIIGLAARHQLPAVYFERNFVIAGGLISYGANFRDQYRQAASYVDRILKGEKPENMPVQAPTKYNLVVNLKTARALGINLPNTLIGRAEEVIE